MTSLERSQWLFKQLAPSQPTPELSSDQKEAFAGEWAVFLENEGIPQNKASDLAIGCIIWTKRLQQALHQLRESGHKKIRFKAERTWTISTGPLRTTCTVARPTFSSRTEDESSVSEAVVLTTALDCLTRHYRFCHREKCRELFLAKRKKKYCSPKCALTVAKRNYRARKRDKPSPMK